MQLSRYVAPINLSRLFSFVRRPAKILGLTFVPPFVAALLAGEWSYAAMFAVIASLSSLAGWQGRPGEPFELSPRDALVLAAIMYLLFASAGAIVYLPIAGIVDSLFESMSGFTTTGLSVLDVTTLPWSLVFFRAYSQWIGGAGIIVLFIALLPGPRAMLHRLYAADGSEDNVLGSVVATTRLVFKIYGGLTLLGFIAYIACGMPVADAVIHVLATLSTGGFSSRPDSIGHYDSMAVQLTVCLFMIAGATALPLYYRARVEGPRRLFQDPQLRALLLVIATAWGASLIYSGWSGEPRALVGHLFGAVSAVTTTGFHVADTSSWAPGTRLLVVVLMSIGGCAGSTAGGIKLFRLLILVRILQWYVTRRLLPDEAQLPIRYGKHVVRDDEIKRLVGFMMAYVVLVALSTGLITLAGFAPQDALFETTSALGTVGLSAGVTSAAAPAWVKLVLVFDMWAGRLEILPLLILFYPHTWIRSRRSS